MFHSHCCSATNSSTWKLPNVTQPKSRCHIPFTIGISPFLTVETLGSSERLTISCTRPHPLLFAQPDVRWQAFGLALLSQILGFIPAFLAARVRNTMLSRVLTVTSYKRSLIANSNAAVSTDCVTFGKIPGEEISFRPLFQERWCATNVPP